MLLKVTVVIFLITNIDALVEFRIKNNDGRDIWIGIQGNAGKEALVNGGFVLGAHKQVGN